MTANPNFIETIRKKRDGQALTSQEIRDFVAGVVSGAVAEYQASAFLMAVYLNGMSDDETVAMTRAMLESGERYDLSEIAGPKVDKHSTGGVGDKVSLILAPLAAACGLVVPMMSGRGLGHSGGTLDKLESIPGFSVKLSRERFVEILKGLGCAMIGQSESIAPADRKLYALRDVTGTVECIPLIVSSILSKKLAEGTEALVLDVKYGSGAFMKTQAEARLLASKLCSVAKKMKLSCKSVISSMDQPLGYAVGNSLEVQESVYVLRNERHPAFPELSSADLRELTIHLCAQMLVAGGTVPKFEAARKLATAKLDDGSAWEAFLQLVQEQGGDPHTVQNPKLLPLSSHIVHWTARKRGFVTKIDTRAIGELLIDMGGGRRKTTDTIDPGTGFLFHKKVGAKVTAGEPLVTAFLPQSITPADAQRLEQVFQSAVEIKSSRKPSPKLILTNGKH